MKYHQSLNHHIANHRHPSRICVMLPIIFLLLISIALLSGCSRKQVDIQELKTQLNHYLITAKGDGTLDAIENLWFSDDEENKKLDYSVLTGENGTIQFGTKSVLPFSYLKDDQYVGIVPDIMLRFCRQYGYKIEYMDFADTNALVLAVSAGKCDFGGSTVSVTEERKKTIDYSESYFINSGVIVMNQEDALQYTDFSFLNGKRIGVITGTIYHDQIKKTIPSSIVYEYNTPSDLCQALFSKKVDAIAHDYGVLRYALNNYTSEIIVDTLIDNDLFAFVFPKNSSGISGWWSKIAESFNRTIIQDNRWQQILKGVYTTLLITITSMIAGTLLGFILCMASRRKNKIIIKLINGFSWLIRGLPTVVLLMIMYYIIFGSVSISGTIVAIISFSLIFAVTVCGLLTNGIQSVDRGQFEACAALGYSEKIGFRKMILPQAIRFSMPAFKTEVISLIKATAIVGYIAVQDLTKTGDIIRSSTYEAFFPLILTAIIYFILAWVLTKIVNGIQLQAFSRNEQKKFLKGVDRHAGD